MTLSGEDSLRIKPLDIDPTKFFTIVEYTSDKKGQDTLFHQGGFKGIRYVDEQSQIYIKVDQTALIRNLDFVGNNEEAHHYKTVDIKQQFNGTADEMQQLLKQREISGTPKSNQGKTFAEWSKIGRLQNRFKNIGKPFYVRNTAALENGEKIYDVLHNHKTSNQGKEVIQRLEIIRKVGDKMELIAGERRWRASQLLGLETVPVIERPSTDQEVLEMALIENLQRQDLNAIEEAAGYVRLAKDFSLKQEEIANRVGKSRASVANAMRLLDLQESIQRHVADGYLTVGHAKAILGVKDPKNQLAVAEQILRRHMTVRAAEKFVQEFLKNGQKKGKKKGQETIDPHIARIQNQLRNHFATHVQITHKEKKGKIELEYYGNDDLGRILNLLGVSVD